MGHARSLSPTDVKQYLTITRKLAELEAKGDPDPSRVLVARLQSEVEAEIPAGSLWWPEHPASDPERH